MIKSLLLWLPLRKMFGWVMYHRPSVRRKITEICSAAGCLILTFLTVFSPNLHKVCQYFYRFLHVLYAYIFVLTVEGHFAGEYVGTR